MKKVHVIVSGRVQGVGFRAWTAETAQSLYLGGWVRNQRDGTVEAVLCGDTKTVEHMLGLLERGPTGAWVEGVEASDWDGTSFADFSILPTRNY